MPFHAIYTLNHSSAPTLYALYVQVGSFLFHLPRHRHAADVPISLGGHGLITRARHGKNSGKKKKNTKHETQNTDNTLEAARDATKESLNAGQDDVIA